MKKSIRAVVIGSFFLGSASLAVNIAGAISVYGANSHNAGFDYEACLLAFSTLWGRSSSNLFVLPLQTLQAISEAERNGIVRITGTGGAIDFDFYRRAKARGLPIDELRQFLARVESEI